MRAVSRRLGLSLAAALVLPSLARAQALSEADAVARAVARAPTIRASQAAAEQLAGEERLRRSVLNPTVRWQQENAAGIRDRFLTVDQELPLNGRRALLAKGATSAIAAARERTAAETLAVSRSARSAYAAVLGSQAREQVLTEGLAALDTVTARLRAREQAGEGSTVHHPRYVARGRFHLPAGAAAQP